MCVLMVEGMSVVVNAMLSLMSVLSPPPALCNLSARTVVKLCTLGVFALGVITGECCFGGIYGEWYGVCDFVVLSVGELCLDYGGENVFQVCLDFCVVYGVGVCVKICVVVCVVVCCLFLTSMCRVM